jgi:GTP-binding protein HflX
VDASSPQVFEQIESVNKALKDIGCDQKPILTLLNKCDTIHNQQLFDALQTVHPDAIAISAKAGLNLDKVSEVIADRVRGGNVRFRIQISQADGKLLSFLRGNAQRLDEQYEGDMVNIEAILGKHQFVLFRKLGAQGFEMI